MIKGIDVNQRIEFSLSVDDSEPKTIFVLRPLTAGEMMDLSSMTGKSAAERSFNLLEKSIVEVKNYDHGNKAISDIVQTLPIVAINELSLKIAEINHLNEAERKNS